MDAPGGRRLWDQEFFNGGQFPDHTQSRIGTETIQCVASIIDLPTLIHHPKPEMFGRHNRNSKKHPTVLGLETSKEDFKFWFSEAGSC